MIVPMFTVGQRVWFPCWNEDCQPHDHRHEAEAVKVYEPTTPTLTIVDLQDDNGTMYSFPTYFLARAA